MNKNRFWTGTVLTLTAVLLLTGGAVRTGEAAVKEHEANVHAGISFYDDSRGVFRVDSPENTPETVKSVNSPEPADAALSESPAAASTAKPAESKPPAEKPSPTVKPTVTPVPGRLVHRKYTTNYVFCGGKKLKHSFITIRKKTYYFDKSGDMHKGWLKLAGQYYYLDRASGVMVHQGKVDGIRIRKDHAVKSRLNVRKIDTMRTAARVAAKITKPSDTMEQKKMKCYRYIMKCDYRRYRFLEPIYKKKGWESTFANDIFKHHAGCCVSESSALAFLFHEIGYRNVYVCHDTSHAWVELNGRVYDNLFSEAKDFWKYYDCTYESFGLNPVDKRKI